MARNIIVNQQENTLKVVENIDRVIDSTCETIINKDCFECGQDAMILALATLVIARATLSS